MISEHANPLALLGSEDAGGQNVYVYEVSLGLARLGYHVDVFCRRDRPDVPEVVPLGKGVRVVHVDAGPPAFVRKDDLWTMMPAFARGCRLFLQRQERPYDLLHSNFWMSGWVACELAAGLGLPVVHIFHALGAIKRLEQGRADTSPKGRARVERRVMREAHRLIAQCPAEAEDLKRHYGHDLHNVVIVPSGVNTRRFRPVPRSKAKRHLGLDTCELIVGYVGRLVPRKGVDTLLEAVARLRTGSNLPLRVMVVGGEHRDPDKDDNPEMRRLRSLAGELDIGDRVWFTGKRQPDELVDYYGAADVMVSVPWYEPFGLTPLEAQACGRAFVGSAVGGITYTVAHGESGWLVPPRDPEALAQALTKLLCEPRLRRDLAREGRRRVVRDFTWNRVAERTASIYESLLQR
ncbi:MAG: glycosyltransferase [Anaerolineae bacterium]